MSRPHIFFDLDGTLLDSIPSIVASLRYTFESKLGFSRSDDVLISGIGTPLDEQIIMHYESEFKSPPSTDDLTMLRQTYVDHNLATHDEVIRPFDGVPELLNTLRSADGDRNQHSPPSLDVCTLTHVYANGYDDVEHPKPHPEPVFKAMELSGAEPKDCLFVGDAPHDILAGRRAGVATAGVLWGPFSAHVLKKAQPTHLFGSMQEISQWAAARQGN